MPRLKIPDDIQAVSNANISKLDESDGDGSLDGPRTGLKVFVAQLGKAEINLRYLRKLSIAALRIEMGDFTTHPITINYEGRRSVKSDRTRYWGEIVNCIQTAAVGGVGEASQLMHSPLGNDATFANCIPRR